MAENENEAVESRPASRRAMMAGLVGGGAIAAIAALEPDVAAAARGGAVVQGVVNAAGAYGTTLNSASAAPTMSMRNTGTGAAALMQSNNSNGFAGGSFSPNYSGVSAVNYSTVTGAGAAIAAGGGANDGINALTSSNIRQGVFARNLSTNTIDLGAAVAAFGGTGVYGEDTTDGAGWGVFCQGDAAIAGNLYLDGQVFGPDAAATEGGTVAMSDGGDVVAVGDGSDGEWDYQLTAIGVPMPDLHVVDVQRDGSFRIAGAPAGATVSWRATRRVVATRSSAADRPTASKGAPAVGAR